MLNPIITIEAKYRTTAFDSSTGSICRDNRIVAKCNTTPKNKSHMIFKIMNLPIQAQDNTSYISSFLRQISIYVLLFNNS